MHINEFNVQKLIEKQKKNDNLWDAKSIPPVSNISTLVPISELNATI